jgi:hypothetical protein
MKKKRYFRTSKSSLALQSLIVTALLITIFLAVFLNVSYFTLSFRTRFESHVAIVFAVIFYIGILPLAYLEAMFLFNNIVLGKDKMYTRGDLKLGKSKIQYHVAIEYKDVRRVAIMPLRRDSRGVYKEVLNPLPFMVIEKNNGRKVLFSLRFMSVKTFDRLLTELSSRCSGPTINVNQIVKEFENYYKIYSVK